MQDFKYDMVAILGATASGKTTVATNLAYRTNAEIISADSRQLYRGMDLGTGKDLEEYTVNDYAIPYHLIDIADAGDRYNIFTYQKDFIKAYGKIKSRERLPILCGGSGMYLDTVLKGYRLAEAPEDRGRREELYNLPLNRLQEILKEHTSSPIDSDMETKRRCIRAIEKHEFGSESEQYDPQFPEINTLIVGVKFEREERRERITERLHQRIEQGMIEEVEGLINSGIKPEDLIYYGLEYKYLTEHILGITSRDEMIEKLNIAIHQFAKRQMTWFRKMEKRGDKILWLDGNMPTDEKIELILEAGTK